ncbi:hypothetical protein BJ508DRAFT_330090 [Ascobolus immersus RN42]|uniref:Transmembrane protein n=1 Tax=Ascobolus immersus RN42 TaxID=1160509 RepID=A0A3N4HUP9_ASCIM|nr:hypothetical protein BJ508DRAFT_330090 [Ascobolus immersus RN42]
MNLHLLRQNAPFFAMNIVVMAISAFCAFSLKHMVISWFAAASPGFTTPDATRYHHLARRSEEEPKNHCSCAATAEDRVKSALFWFAASADVFTHILAIAHIFWKWIPVTTRIASKTKTRAVFTWLVRNAAAMKIRRFFNKNAAAEEVQTPFEIVQNSISNITEGLEVIAEAVTGAQADLGHLRALRRENDRLRAAEATFDARVAAEVEVQVANHPNVTGN